MNIPKVPTGIQGFDEITGDGEPNQTDVGVSSIWNITQHKNMQIALRKARDELEQVLRDLQEKQNQILEMEKLKSVQELAAAVSHEISQPLQIMSSIIFAFEHGDTREKYIEQFHHLIKRIAQLTNQLRNITKIHKKDYLDTQILDLEASALKITPAEIGNILIVDDEKMLVDTLVKSFRAAGYFCDGTYNGDSALAKIQNKNYRLIISDISMPDMSGITLFKRVRMQTDPPVFVFLTGYNVPHELYSLVSQADEIIQKPVIFGDLEKII